MSSHWLQNAEIIFYQQSEDIWAWGYKTFFKLNSVEHEIFPANEY